LDCLARRSTRRCLAPRHARPCSRAPRGRHARWGERGARVHPPGLRYLRCLAEPGPARRHARAVRGGATIMALTELFSLEGKAAIVTGGGRGIGRTIAEAYLESGARVLITGRRTEFLDPTLTEFTQRGLPCRAVQADVTAPEAVERVVAEALEAFG